MATQHHEHNVLCARALCTFFPHVPFSESFNVLVSQFCQFCHVPSARKNCLNKISAKGIFTANTFWTLTRQKQQAQDLLCSQVMLSNSINNHCAETTLNSVNNDLAKNPQGKNRCFKRCHQLLFTTMSRKQKDRVISSNFINNDLVKATSTKLLCFHVMPSNSISNDLVKTSKKFCFQLQEMPSIKPL